jgi:hypothetical protein
MRKLLVSRRAGAVYAASKLGLLRTGERVPPIRKQLEPLNGVERKAVRRRVERVKNMMHELPEPAQRAIKESIDERASDEQ